MNLQSLVVVVLRLMALNFLLSVAVQLSLPFTRWLQAIHGSSMGTSAVDAALPWLMLIGLVLSAVSLWVFALPIAGWVTTRVPQDLSLDRVTLADCYSVAFIGVGLLYLANGLPQVLNWSHYMFKLAASTSGDSWKSQVDFYQVSQAFIPFVVGVLLFANGRRWAVALARRQRQAESPNPPLEPLAAAGNAGDNPDGTGGGSHGSA